MHIKPLVISSILTISVVGTATKAPPVLGTPASGSIEQPAVHQVSQADLYVWRVYFRDASDEDKLLSGEWDVLESRGVDYLRVLGDEAVAQSLRGLGYRVAVDEVISAGIARTPLTYYYGYHLIP